MRVDASASRSRSRSGLLWLRAEQLADACSRLSRERFVVAIAGMASTTRGSLRRTLDDAIEASLAARGALPATVDVDAELPRVIRDQVFRAHALGASGLALVVPTLEPICEGGRILDPDDASTLTAWLEAVREGGLVVALDDASRAVRVMKPVCLGELGAPSRPVADEEHVRPPAPVDVEASRPLRADRPAEPTKAAPPAATPQPPRAVLRREAPPCPPPNRVISAAEWRAHAVELDAARGPKPIAVIEKLFAHRYAPLLGAALRGELDAAVRAVVDTWRASFERTYTETFASLRVTGKRPPMVFDAPDLAGRLARQSNARAVKLVLVDALRFDVGEQLANELGRRIAGKAVCVDRAILWAALPTTTPTQIALLARGADALRDAPVSESEPDVSRVRAVAVARRERIGGREVMKIDLVEARVHSSGPAYDERVRALASEVADVLERLVNDLPPRTLLYVFGDHGFRWTASVDHATTMAATQGGASPEEVLVPAYAYLVGGVH